ncbi:MAG TPA: CDP-alcohol phosphatidyltransferase family protein [Candidatus Faecousia intestinigallinarum]|nr:CDP-alcohol phosphatidyltransferase family protein [Candidatus Faecousia intestinigallinarum]
MFIKSWKKEIFTIPNILSMFRLALIPVYVIIYLNATEPGHYFLSAAILAVSCLTDLIDGKIARKFHMISNLGKILDPVADKATQFTLIICLAVRHPVLWYLVGLFVVKEGFQAVAGMVLLHRRQILKGALITGKVCTTILFLSLILLVLLPGLPQDTVRAIAAVDAVFMLVAFVDYIFAFMGKRDKIEALDVDPNDALGG